MDEPRKIYKSKANRILAGVCGGIGEYFDVDPAIIRIVFVLLTIWAGIGLVLYIIGIVIIPEQGAESIAESKNKEELKKKIQETAADVKNTVSKEGRSGRGEQTFGLILLLLGFILLFNAFFPWVNFHRLWPLLLVVIGISILISSAGKERK